MVLLFALSVTSAQAAEPSASQQALYTALSGRHLEQSCAQLTDLSATPQDDLVWLAENAEQPAWVAVRAAECVLELYAEPASPTIQRWMQSEATLGLAIVTTQHLDGLPLRQAKTLVQAGLSGPLAAQLRPRVERLTVPELRALAAAPAP